MKTMICLRNRLIAKLLSILIVAQISTCAAESQQVPSAPQQAPALSDAPTPKSPPSAPINGQESDQNSLPRAQQPAASQQPAENQKPLGTAAAPFEKTEGVAASRPAGAAIAPGKQRRVHTLLIRMSIVIGAGAALGTVAALSHASPSQPPK
jgi:hypothetical protein